MKKRPNILYIMTDQQRYDDLGLYGLTPVETPALDRLAASGMRFDRAYSCCALCSPARASMLTGKYPHTHRMWNNNDMMQWARRELPDDVELIVQPLSASGYRCGYAGKWHCGREKVPSSYGFEGMDVPDYGVLSNTAEYAEYLEKNGLARPERRPEAWTTSPDYRPIAGVMEGDIRAAPTYFLSQYCIDMLKSFQEESRRTGNPWFFFLSYWLPHPSYFPPREYAEMIPPDEVTLWGNFSDTLEGKPPNQRRYRESYHRAMELDEEEWKLILARSFAQMSFLDSQIGRVLDFLQELGIEDETAVLFGTDHGDMRGGHGRFLDKDAYMYEEIYHIPQIVRWPGVTGPGSVSRRFVLNMDLAPTALEIAGLPVPTDYEARSLVPLLSGGEDNAGGAGEAIPWPDDVMCEFHGHRFLCSVRMVRWANYKYVLNLTSFDELYDLEADPWELDNRIDDPAMREVLSEGRNRLLAWIDKTNDDIAWAAGTAIAAAEGDIRVKRGRTG